MITNPDLKTIGDNYGKSVAQMILRWLVQREIIPLAKTVNKESSFFNHQEVSSVEMLASLIR